MSRRAVAWLLAILTLLGVVAQAALLAAVGVPLFSAEAVERTFPVLPAATLVGAVVGGLIVSRHPTHPIGWLFCFGQAGAAFGLAAQMLGSAVLVHGLDAPARVGHLAAWVGNIFGSGYALTLIAALFLLVPDGRLPSRRWAPVLGLLVGSYGLTVLAVLITPPAELPRGGPGQAGNVATVLGALGQLGVTLAVFGGAAAFAVRLRRSRGEERQQLRWIAVAALTLTGTLLLNVLVGLAAQGSSPWFLQLALHVSYLAVPVTTGFAVLRHRLYDVDVIIGSAVRLGALLTFVTVGYVAAVVGIGTALGGAGSAVWASLAAYVLVALAFQPLRRRVDRLADRIVHGRRAAPYDSLAEFSRQLGASRSDPELLEVTARACAEVAGARRAVVRVWVDGAADLSTEWPSGQGPPPATSIPVIHQGDVLGEIGLDLPPGRSLTRAQRRLLREFAAQEGLAFRNLALTGALQARATFLLRANDELAASRRRLLTAADTGRAQVAAAIRQDVASYLHPFPDRLDNVLMRGPRAAEAVDQVLEELDQATNRAIEALRVITGGVFPPLLARRGLAPALRSFARQSRARPNLLVGAGVESRRFGPEVEAATYFCCVEAVRGMLPGTEFSVDAVDGSLSIVIRGRRPELDTDDRVLADRVEAVGGQMVLTARVDGSSELRADIPVASDQIDDSRSAPKSDLLMYAAAPLPPASANVSSS